MTGSVHRARGRSTFEPIVAKGSVLDVALVAEPVQEQRRQAVLAAISLRVDGSPRNSVGAPWAASASSFVAASAILFDIVDHPFRANAQWPVEGSMMTRCRSHSLASDHRSPIGGPAHSWCPAALRTPVGTLATA